MRALVVGLSGPVVATAALRAARRAEVRARFTGPGRARRLPEPARLRLVAALEAAGVPVAPEEAAVVWAAAAVGVAVVALGLGVGAPGAVVVALGAACAPVVGLRYARAGRERALAGAVPGLVDRLAAELRAGATLTGAIAGVAGSDHPLAPDLRVVDAGVALGLPPAEALAGWARRRTTPGVAEVAGALAMCATVGGRAAEALDGLAAALRDRMAVAAEARALSAQARASAVLVGGAPVAVLAWSALTGGGALRALLATPGGWVCTVLGVGLEGAGAWWMHRIIRSGGATVRRRRPPSARTVRRIGGRRAAYVVATVGSVLGAPGRVRRARADDDEMAAEVATAVDILAVAVSAGCTPFLAIEEGARWCPPRVAAASREIVRACSVGATFDDAMADAGRRRPALRGLTDALRASAELGTPAGPALLRLGVEQRADLRRRAEARARTVPVRLCLPLVGCILPAFALLTVVPVVFDGLRP